LPSDLGIDSNEVLKGPASPGALLVPKEPMLDAEHPFVTENTGM
jgi:hypothetical protein